MRIFVSISWSKEAIAFLQSWQEKLYREYGIKGYWRKPNNLHLTLKFLGEVGKLEISAIDQALKEVSSQFSSFDCLFKDLGVFPNVMAPRILWLGVQSPVLFSLQSAVDSALRNIGIPSENRKYRPHITLASGGIDGIDERTLKRDNLIIRNERITSFELMQSVMECGSHVYHPLGVYALKKDAAII